jgi:hypothetical protein
MLGTKAVPNLRTETVCGDIPSNCTAWKRPVLGHLQPIKFVLLPNQNPSKQRVRADCNRCFINAKDLTAQHVFKA